MDKVEILDKDELYRRIPPWHLKNDNSITSAAFHNTNHTDDMSVDLGKLTTPQKTVSSLEGFSVAVFIAELARKENQEVFHSPEPDNYAHSTVRGRKTRGISRRLAKVSKIILSP